MTDLSRLRWTRRDFGRQARLGTVVIGLLLVVIVARVPGLLPLAVPAAVAWWFAGRDRAPSGSVDASIDVAGMLEQDRIALTLSASDLDQAVQATVVVTHHLTREPVVVGLDPSRPVATLTLTPHLWGAARIGPVVLRAMTPGGATWTADAPVTGPTKNTDERGRLVVPIHPRTDVFGTLPGATTTTPGPGVHTARTAGRGIEFADLRPHQPGDNLRDVDWRVSARRGELWVSQRHPEQRQDVVLLVDTFDGEVLPDAVRLAYGLTSVYLAQRDRIGVIGFGGVLRWLTPGGGSRHQVRVESALVASQAAVSAAWRDLRVVPPRTLPAHALVVALTPLREERTRAALADLLARGRQLTVIDVAERLTSPRLPRDPLLERLDRLQRETEHSRLRRFGATVVVWAEGETPHSVVARAAIRQRQRVRS